MIQVAGSRSVQHDLGRAGQKFWKSFAAALAIGGQDLTKNAENFQQSENPDYQLIPIVAARKLGILPIAFQSDRDFVASPKPAAKEEAAEGEGANE